MLEAINHKFVYRDAKTSQISFPLGGIGSGSIGLAGNGRLIDWEIFNRPNKGSVNGFSHFAIRAERGDKVLDARVLQGDLRPPYQGELPGTCFNAFGWGPRREYLTGLPHFAQSEFRGEFPFGELLFADSAFPGAVKLLAFNPLIPLNDHDSSIPAAFFEISVENPTSEPLTYTVAGILANPLPENNLNSLHHAAWGSALHLTSDSIAATATGCGDMTLAVDTRNLPADAVSWQRYWYRGAWFDSLEMYWRDFTTAGPLRDRVYAPKLAGDKNEGMLAVHLAVATGATARVRFVISWNFPNCYNYWKGYPAADLVQRQSTSATWRNYYAIQWQDSQASAEYALTQWDRLFAETKIFKDALFASDLPPAALDAVSANISILKTPTVLRLEDGTLYGWEGCHPAEGCCEGSCTHVWNYAQALPFLFPKLERSMRDADYAYNLRPDGGMPFRLQLPIGSGYWSFRPCADGQFGGVLKTYRDRKICGDTEWLRRLWPSVRQSIEFAWSPANFDRWDPDKTGVLWGRQHHTLDMELFGPNSWLSGFYLGALKAGAEMATALGEHQVAGEYQALFARGKAWVDANLFNGSYYYQRVNLHDRALVEQFADEIPLVQGGSTLEGYWNAETGEVKYQIGEGCSIDQVLAQWHADLYGLGDLLDRVQVEQACAAIFQYNFVSPMGSVYNPCRIYCLNDEAGLTICAWPQGAYKPVIPAPYSQETMNGFEYSAATHMIMNGLVDAGMRAVEAIRRRYDGERRNPWNEFECGSNYARSMASYALLNAFSGFAFDMARGYIGFNPVRVADGHFRCFWSLDSGWGEFELSPNGCAVRVLAGQLTLHTLCVPDAMSDAIEHVTLTGAGADRPIEARQTGVLLSWDTAVTIGAGQTLQCSARA